MSEKEKEILKLFRKYYFDGFEAGKNFSKIEQEMAVSRCCKTPLFMKGSDVCIICGHKYELRETTMEDLLAITKELTEEEKEMLNNEYIPKDEPKSENVLKYLSNDYIPHELRMNAIESWKRLAENLRYLIAYKFKKKDEPCKNEENCKNYPKSCWVCSYFSAFLPITQWEFQKKDCEDRERGGNKNESL